MSEKIVVCGAGGYVGGKLIEFLCRRGYPDIRAVSSSPVSSWKYRFENVEVVEADLRNFASCLNAINGATWVYNLAAKVGGIGFIGKHKAECMMSSLINTNLLRAASGNSPSLAGYFFASSSCVYPDLDTPLKESDAYPAQPMDGYGWDKLFSEQVCAAFREDYGIPVSVARYHTIYGPGDYRPLARDHVTAALCKKVITAKLSGVHEINIWGDGTQTRSFLYIDDCTEGTFRLLTQGVEGPVNLGNCAEVSVNEIVSYLEDIAGVKLQRFYSEGAPVGRKHKRIDNTLIRKRLRWEPMIPIEDGLQRMFNDYWGMALKNPAFCS